MPWRRASGCAQKIVMEPIPLRVIGSYPAERCCRLGLCCSCDVVLRALLSRLRWLGIRTCWERAVIVSDEATWQTAVSLAIASPGQIFPDNAEHVRMVTITRQLQLSQLPA